MGCWNETCGVTQLPILAGDKVRLFVLRGGGPTRREGGGTCYINDIWSPIGPPISGVYNDYGGIEEVVQDKAAEMLFEAIKQNWPKDTIEESRGETIKSLEDMELSDALHYIERDYIKLKGYQGEDEKLGVMFMLEEVYQTMIDYNPIEPDFSTQPYRYAPLHTTYMKDILAYYNDTFESYKTIREAKQTEIERSMSMFRLTMGSDCRLFHDYRDRAGKDLQKELIKFCETGIEVTHPKVQELITMTVNWFLINNSMTEARKFWTPQTGKGGQHQELDIYRLINQTSNQIMDVRIKEWEEENEVEGRDENGYFPYQIEQNKKLSDSE